MFCSRVGFFQTMSAHEKCWAPCKKVGVCIMCGFTPTLTATRRGANVSPLHQNGVCINVWLHPIAHGHKTRSKAGAPAPKWCLHQYGVCINVWLHPNAHGHKTRAKLGPLCQMMLASKWCLHQCVASPQRSRPQDEEEI
jgi:hypothetical protein